MKDRSQTAKSPQKLLALRRVAPRVLSFATRHKRDLIFGFLALSIASGINLLFPYLLRRTLNNELGFELHRDLLLITTILVLLFAIQALFFYIRHYTFVSVGYRVVSELRDNLFQAIMAQDIAFFDESRVGDLLSRLSSDCQVIQRAVTINISVALRYLIQVVGGIILCMFISPRLTLLILLLVPALAVASMYWGKRLRVLSKVMQEELAEANVVAEEAVSSMKTVRIFAGSNYETARYERAVERSLQAGLARTKLAAVFSSTMVFLLNAAIALVVYYGGVLILRNDMSIGDLSAFLLYCVIVAVSFGFLVGVWDEFMQAVGASERIFEIIDNVPRVTSPTHPRALPPSRNLGVLFERVDFAYPTRPDIPILKDLSFEIPAGKTLAFVGPSGAGKSTIASLIPRFYDPLAGKIYFGGIAINELNLEELRSAISLVAQSPQVFSLSILDNIRYGRLDASECEVIEAAKAANLHEFISALPEGYRTKVGDKGVQLSGGERQRLTIARAILKNPRLLILDEATSSLDSANEQAVQQALQNLMKDRTTMIIAHRLATVQHADEVLVLHHGKVIQHGTHSDLMNKPGMYRDLVQHQLLS